MDDYVGETFEDRDYRAHERRVKVIAMVHKNNRVAYEVEVVSNPVNPSTVGRRTTIKASTLDAKYRRIS